MAHYQRSQQMLCMHWLLKVCLLNWPDDLSKRSTHSQHCLLCWLCASHIQKNQELQDVFIILKFIYCWFHTQIIWASSSCWTVLACHVWTFACGSLYQLRGNNIAHTPSYLNLMQREPRAILETLRTLLHLPAILLYSNYVGL